MSHRTQITLTDEQYERLRAESLETGLGLAELVRRAVDRSYGVVDRGALRTALDDSFGSWSGAGDGADYVDALRRGMEHRLGETTG
jgi:hypothetical protein